MLFKKAVKEAEKAIETSAPKTKPEEEWIWVEGYKGTDRDMKCRNYQYELGVQYDMPEDEEIKECESGFHLCLCLNDVFGYYGIGQGNRFFKVKALIRKSDKDRYGTCTKVTINQGTTFILRHGKLAAKSIIFESELTTDEILKGTMVNNLPDKYKQMAIDDNICQAITSYQIDTLIDDGYSQPFVHYMVKNNKFEIAHAFGSQKDLSMDMKVLGIFWQAQLEQQDLSKGVRHSVTGA